MPHGSHLLDDYKCGMISCFLLCFLSNLWKNVVGSCNFRHKKWAGNFSQLIDFVVAGVTGRSNQAACLTKKPVQL